MKPIKISLVGFINPHWKEHFRFYTIKELDNHKVALFPPKISKAKCNPEQEKVKITIEVIK